MSALGNLHIGGLAALHMSSNHTKPSHAPAITITAACVSLSLQVFQWIHLEGSSLADRIRCTSSHCEDAVAELQLLSWQPPHTHQMAALAIAHQLKRLNSGCTPGEPQEMAQCSFPSAAEASHCGEAARSSGQCLSPLRPGRVMELCWRNHQQAAALGAERCGKLRGGGSQG